MPTTKAGNRLLRSFSVGSETARGHWIEKAIDAIEEEAREDCEREMLRQRDCSHSECIEHEEEAIEEAYTRGYEAGRGWSS